MLSARIIFSPSQRNIKQLDFAPARPPLRYSLPGREMSLQNICPEVWKDELFHRSQGNEVMVRLTLPPEVRAALAGNGLALPAGAEVEIVSFLNQGILGADGSWLLGYTAPSADVSVKDLEQFYPPGEVPKIDLSQPRIFVNLNSDRYTAKDTFQLACDIAYYHAKGMFQVAVPIGRFKEQGLLARFFALSLQHRTGISLIGGRFQFLENSGITVVSHQATPENKFVGSWFRGVHRGFQTLLNQDSAVYRSGRHDYSRFRQEAEQLFEIEGSLGELSTTKPVIVTLKQSA